MWNYEFMFPSMMTFLVILVGYFSRPHPPVHMNRTFLALMITNAVVCVLDIVSSRMDENYAVLPETLLWAANMLYFIFFVLRIFLFFRFTVDALGLYGTPSVSMVWGARSVFILTELAVLSSFFTGAVFTIDAQGYHKGPLYDVLYICAFFYTLYALGMMILYSAGLRRGEKAGLLGCHLLLLAGYIGRILFPWHLVMDTFCVLALLVIFLVLENPDLYISDRTTVFNTQALRSVLSESGRNRSCRILAMVIRDYNEQRSIAGGPQMDHGIRLISQYLTRLCPRESIYYLRGGCFVILSLGNMDPVKLSGRIRDRFRMPWTAEDLHLYLTPAFVQIRTGDYSASPDSIIDTLMIALENASRASPQETLSEKDSMGIVSRQIEVKRTLENALDNNRVEVFLQPIFDCKAGRIAAAEALARIRDEQGRLVSPGEFIPLAEKSGHIIELGEQVLRKTCMFIQDYGISSMGLSWINVNLSPVQCTRGDLAEHFASILEQDRVDPSMIHFEITEQSMVDYKLLERQMISLKEKGFFFSLDDYGSGYSNLTRVRHFPFVNVKLDMDLVRDSLKSQDSLVSSLVSMFHKMGFSVTAEGIEDAGMAEAMKKIGCDYLQGYYYSIPLPMDDFWNQYALVKEEPDPEDPENPEDPEEPDEPEENT